MQVIVRFIALILNLAAIGIALFALLWIGFREIYPIILKDTYAITFFVFWGLIIVGPTVSSSILFFGSFSFGYVVVAYIFNIISMMTGIFAVLTGITKTGPSGEHNPLLVLMWAILIGSPLVSSAAIILQQKFKSRPVNSK